MADPLVVLGTGGHRRGVRATMFSFEDKGIFYFSGEGEAPRIVRGVYIDAPEAEKIARRARTQRERAGTLTGHALGEASTTRTGPAYDLLADIAAVAAEPKCWPETVVTRLAELRPEVYGPQGGLEPEDRAAWLGGLHFHDLRHTGNTLASATGTALRSLMARMGHDNPRAALIYQHTTDEADREWRETIKAQIRGNSL